MVSYAEDGERGPSNESMRDPSLFEEEQEMRLLSAEEGSDLMHDEKNFKVEWQLRTRWVMVGSALSVAAVFSIMVLFAQIFIVSSQGEELDSYQTLQQDFRRPAGDYILDPDWDFDAPNTIRTYNWTILDRVANPDGVYRPMIMINGEFPGPMIECNEGDTLLINVENLSSNATSMHFHGIYQNGTNWMDGTTGVTQCPIAPSGRFQYQFTIEGQSGTYYYHGHQAVQVSDGLFGPLVVHGRTEKQIQRVPYVSDRVLMVQDYYHDLSNGLLKTSLEPGNEGAPVPNGALINGRNVRGCASVGDRLCDTFNSQAPLFEFAPDASHRLRFINVGSLAWFEISLDEHSFSVTEVDGTDAEPVSSSQVHISPAQRYSTIITTNSTTSTSFWLRARIMKHCFKEPDMPDEVSTVNGIVQYASSRSPKSMNQLIKQPTSRNTVASFGVICRDMDNKQFVPVVREIIPPHADYTYYLRSNIEIGDWRLERGYFNESSFRPNVHSPSLHRIIDGLRSNNVSFEISSETSGVNRVAFDEHRELVIQTIGIKTVDLIIQNFDEGNHPMHLHGNKFWVLGQGHAYFPGYDQLDLGRLMEGSVLRRDTASVEGFGWMAIRFTTDNPGIWAFHCHMAWHSEAGLAMLFLNQPEAMKNWELPEGNLRLCEAPLGELEKGMPPKDETWFGSGT